MTNNEIATNFPKLPEVPMNPHDELLLGTLFIVLR